MEINPFILVIGGIGVLLTIYLIITGKNNKNEPPTEKPEKTIGIFKFILSSIAFVYIIRLAMMTLTGILSQQYLPTLVGALIAVLPLGTLLIIEHPPSSKLNKR